MESVACMNIVDLIMQSQEVGTTGLGTVLLAYIDPGTGSYLFQMLVAGLLTFLMMLRHVREFMRVKVLGFLKRKHDGVSATPTAKAEPARVAP
jgi:hypothetical protein